jgi:RNA polymerase sigma-70 factor (ECF subfamily)
LASRATSWSITWRRLTREERSLRTIGTQEGVEQTEDPWDVHLDGPRARETLERLAAQHRAVLTLRYLDDLPVADVAEILDRTVHATEALLVRARLAFRRAYSEQEDASCA